MAETQRKDPALLTSALMVKSKQMGSSDYNLCLCGICPRALGNN